MERSRLSDFELEEREHMRMKRQREKRALEEAVDIEVGGWEEERVKRGKEGEKGGRNREEERQKGGRHCAAVCSRAVCSMPTAMC